MTHWKDCSVSCQCLYRKHDKLQSFLISLVHLTTCSADLESSPEVASSATIRRSAPAADDAASPLSFELSAVESSFCPPCSCCCCCSCCCWCCCCCWCWCGLPLKSSIATATRRRSPPLSPLWLLPPPPELPPLAPMQRSAHSSRPNDWITLDTNALRSETVARGCWRKQASSNVSRA